MSIVRKLEGLIKDKRNRQLNKFKNDKFIFISTMNLTLKLLKKDILNKSKINKKNNILGKKINRLYKYYFDNKDKYNINCEELNKNILLLNNIDEFDSNCLKRKGLKLIKKCIKEMKNINK